MCTKDHGCRSCEDKPPDDGNDKELRTETVFRRLCIELDPLFVFQQSFYDGRGRLLLDMDRNFDRKAKLE